MPSFFVTIVREPAARCLSHINYFPISRNFKELNTDDKILFFRNKCNGYQYKYIKDIKGERSINYELESYDLIAINERFDESLVLLKYMLHLDWKDLLYIGSKLAGTTDYLSKIILPYKKLEDEDEKLRNFVDNEWKGTNIDYTLYDAALEKFENQTLGIPSFKEKLRYFKMILTKAQRHCRKAVNYKKNKSLESQYECLHKDMGCGVKCLDDFIRNQKMFSSKTPY